MQAGTAGHDDGGVPPYAVMVTRHPGADDADFGLVDQYVVLVNDEATYGGFRWVVEDLPLPLARAVAGAFAQQLGCDVEDGCGDRT